MDVTHLITFLLGLTVGLIPILINIIGEFAFERGVQQSARRIMEEEMEQARNRKH